MPLTFLLLPLSLYPKNFGVLYFYFHLGLWIF